MSALPSSQARAQARQGLPDRLLRAELPPLDARPADLARLKQEVARDLAPFEAMHVLAWLVVTGGIFTRREIYSELNDDSAAPIEYVASILLERGSPQPTGGAEPPAAMSGAIQRTMDRTRGITMQRIMAARRREEQAQSPLEAITAAVEVHDAISRWPGYADQERALLEELSGESDVATSLRATAGFDIAQALMLENAVGDLLTRRFNEHGERTAELVNDHEAALDSRLAAAAGGQRSGRQQEERAERGASLLAQEYFSERLRDALLIAGPELADEAEVDVATAEAFLRSFSVSFGDTKGTTILSGRNIVRSRPFIADGEGRYLLTFPGNLLWGIRPFAETVLKRDREAFHAYEGVRSSYAERETAAHLRKALKTDQVWTNLWYWLDGVRYEADVVACVDDLCVVVEVKSGHMSDRAWRGRKTEVRRDLEALLGRSSTQCGRLVRELRGGRIPRFVERSTSEPISISLEHIDRVEAVVVTLESLGFSGLASRHLRAAGLLGADEPPWVVSLFDLGAVAACTAYTPQFTSYVRRRRQLDERVAFLDECDLWMLHLRETLDFSLVRGPSLLIEGRSDDLNKAWMFGDRQPTMKLDKSSKRRLRELDRKRPPGFVAAGEDIIAEMQAGRRPKVKVFGKPRRS